MESIPVLKTKRLVLRPFSNSDADCVRRLAGDFDIASTTLFIPHPYEKGMAEQWIGRHQFEFENAISLTLAIALINENTLIGAIALSNFRNRDNNASLGYWIGKTYWNHGYCTEASHRMLQYGFETLGLNRIYAHHFKRNPASGKVMQNLGMIREGCMRQHVKKWDQYEDLECYGILRSEFDPNELS